MGDGRAENRKNGNLGYQSNGGHRFQRTYNNQNQQGNSRNGVVGGQCFGSGASGNLKLKQQEGFLLLTVKN